MFMCVSLSVYTFMATFLSDTVFQFLLIVQAVSYSEMSVADSQMFLILCFCLTLILWKLLGTYQCYGGICSLHALSSSDRNIRNCNVNLVSDRSCCHQYVDVALCCIIMQQILEPCSCKMRTENHRALSTHPQKLDIFISSPVHPQKNYQGLEGCVYVCVCVSQYREGCCLTGNIVWLFLILHQYALLLSAVYFTICIDRQDVHYWTPDIYNITWIELLYYSICKWKCFVYQNLSFVKNHCAYSRNLI